MIKRASETRCHSSRECTVVLLSLFLFLMTNPLRWYLIQKKKNKIICKKWKTADICTRLFLLFFFFTRMREGSSCLADPEVCWLVCWEDVCGVKKGG